MTGCIEINQGRARLRVNPMCGMLTEFSWDLGGGERRHWLRPHSGELIATNSASYPLVPYSNRIRNGRFSFDGKDVALPLNFPPQPHSIHGFGWQALWSVTGQTDSSVTIDYRHAADAWPWPWRVTQTFSLTDSGLSMEMDLTNEAEGGMPATLGFHPHFIRTPTASITAEVEKIWLTDDEVMPVAHVVPPLTHRLDQLVAEQVAMDVTYTGWSRTAAIRWPEWNAGLTLEADAPLDFLIVFTPPGKDFFCVEPVSASTDAFNMSKTRDDTGIIALPSGATQHIAARLTPSLDA